MSKKKYQLTNIYFKIARMYGLPQTILEIAEHEKQHGELPFAYNGDNWVYDAMCEKQKREGVYNSQYLTPDATVDRMMHFAGKYFISNEVLEPCCGTGQITKELINRKYDVLAFDIDDEMIKICELLYPERENITRHKIVQGNFTRYDLECSHRNQIIANPPYEIPELTDFFEWMYNNQDYGGISILLLPKGFIDKDKPRRLFEILRKFGVLEREDMMEEFARTKTRAEIVVLKKL